MREFAAKEKLKIVSVRGGAAHFAPTIPSRAKRGEEIRFEQFQEYTVQKHPSAVGG